MALTLEGNYSKKVGLPGFSSHQFSLTLKTEISDITQVETESHRLYRLLQQGVDESIQQVGYLPEAPNTPAKPNNGKPQRPDEWKCTPKQQELILKIIQEQQLDKQHVEQLALDRYGKGVRLLNKLEASALIEELFEKHPRTNGHQRSVPAR